MTIAIYRSIQDYLQKKTNHIEEVYGFKFSNNIVIKASTVALASFSTVCLQLNIPRKYALCQGLIDGSITFVSEGFQSNPERENLFQINPDGQKIECFKIISCVSLFFVFTSFFQIIRDPQKHKAILMEKSIKRIVCESILFPTTEEVLFRIVFRKYYIENICKLVNRFIYPISEGVQKKISNLFQAIFFCTSHNQSLITWDDGPIAPNKFFVAGWLSGYLYDLSGGSLIPSICLHIVRNATVLSYPCKHTSHL